MPNVPVPCLAKQSGEEHKEKQKEEKGILGPDGLCLGLLDNPVHLMRAYMYVCAHGVG